MALPSLWSHTNPQLQRLVYRALRELEVEFTEEFIVSELGYSVDARLLLGTDRKVVLEVD